MAGAGSELFVVCKLWDSVISANVLRATVQKFSSSTSLPSVIIRGKATTPFAVVARGAHASEERVLCSGATAAEVQTTFEAQYGGAASPPGSPPLGPGSPPLGPQAPISRIEFDVKKDRPGLLADASALFKSHQVNIRRALISTGSKGQTAKHVYEFTGLKGKEVSTETFAGLKKGFEKLQVGENPNTVEPISAKASETVDELRAKVFELTAQLEACQAEKERLACALEEAVAKS